MPHATGPEENTGGQRVGRRGSTAFTEQSSRSINLPRTNGGSAPTSTNGVHRGRPRQRRRDHERRQQTSHSTTEELQAHLDQAGSNGEGDDGTSASDVSAHQSQGFAPAQVDHQVAGEQADTDAGGSISTAVSAVDESVETASRYPRDALEDPSNWVQGEYIGPRNDFINTLLDDYNTNAPSSSLFFLAQGTPPVEEQE